MRLTVIGCSGSYPGPESPASCYLLEHDDGGRTWRLLLDLGNGALGTLHRYADPLDVDGVLLSHLHADHCLDLCGYYVIRKYHPRGPQPRIPVWGPAGVAARMAAAYDIPEEPGMSHEFDFHSYAQEPEGTLGPFRFTATRVEHPVAAFALRVEAGGRSVAYSGDTGPSDGLVKAAHDVDLLLAEASFQEGDDNPPGVHLTGREAAEAATASGARRLVLTHIPPWHSPERALAEARPVYDGPIDLAATGARYDLGPA